MILSDGDIVRRLESGDLVIEPLADPELQIQPASVDLRLGREFLEFRRTNIPCIHPDSEREVDEYVTETTVGENEKFILHPRDFVLGTTRERVEIPRDLIAHVEGRSSLGRLAVVVHASLPGDEPVFLWTPTDGFGWYSIGEIVRTRRPARAVAFNPRTLTVDTFRVTDYITNPRKRIYQVTLGSGRSVHVTRDHNLFTLDPHGGVRRIPSEEAAGALVMVPKRLPTSPTPALLAPSAEEHAELTAIEAGPEEFGDEVGRLLGKCDTTRVVPESLAGAVVKCIDRTGRVPDFMWDWPTAAFEGLWRGLTDDGSRRRIACPSASLAGDFQMIAARVGSHARVVSDRTADDHWTVVVHKWTPAAPIPTPSALLHSIRGGADSIAGQPRADGGSTNAESTVGELRQVLESGVTETPARRRLRQLLDGDVGFDRVVAVEATDRVEPTYDLEVQPDGRPIENFIGGTGGIFLSNTAGLCDPGYRGQITLELSNLGTAPVALTPGMRVSQLTFTELTSPAERPYGTDRGSKYQDQRGPQASRIQGDDEFGGEQM